MLHFWADRRPFDLYAFFRVIWRPFWAAGYLFSILVTFLIGAGLRFDWRILYAGFRFDCNIFGGKFRFGRGLSGRVPLGLNLA